MHNVRTLIYVGAFALTGVSAWAIPAAADTLAVDFTASPASNTNSAVAGTAFGYDLVTTNVSLTVTGLGEFVNGLLSNISASGGQMPTGVTTAGDWVYLGSGTTVPGTVSGLASGALISAQINSGDAALAGAFNSWAFTTALTLAAAGDNVLAPGNYWIAVVYGDPNTSVYSTSTVATEANVALNGGAFCTQSDACSSSTTVSFGPNFETGSTPLPAALPLFASGLGAMGLFGWRRKRKNAAAHAAA
jgi:hypothetical protein